MEYDHSSAPEAFKALGDPIRWTIVRYMAAQPELAGSVLEEALPVSRPTISYHIRILTQAGLVEVSKRGRNHFYTLRHDVLHSLLDQVQALMPSLSLVPTTADATPAPQRIPAPSLAPAAGDYGRTAVLPTW